AEFLRATAQNPSLLTGFDCIGNRLDMDVERMLNREESRADTQYGRPNSLQFSQRSHAQNNVPEFFEAGADLSDAARWDSLKKIRSFVTSIGAEQGWDAVDVPSHRTSVPFDEPVLGIIGMWRQGGGANPHFALALGETMLRVGQRYIAWNAFERASMLADRYSPDPQTQEFLKTHCASRQAAIEETLRFVASKDSRRRNPPWQYISLPQEPATIDRMRTAFRAELNDGLAFQKEYQDFESDRLSQGHLTDDEHFFDDFTRNHESIATSVGLEETVRIVLMSEMRAYINRHVQASTIFGSGLGAMIFASINGAIGLWRGRRRP
ncbi:MAG: hypothetical protein O2856_08385, partial [Planctomycetota bacterium]|nr:hypothetical protein [Planctomycetota bacterium]